MHNFSLLIKPASADCNLRCDYCFYLKKAKLYPELTKHRMNYKTLDKLVSGYMSTNQQYYTFSWQGGEPTLMGLDFFKKVTELQSKYGQKGAHVANALQTNATLIDAKTAEHLSKYNFLVGVSLDGPREIHDYYRKTAGGKGSYGMVMNSIQNLRNYHVPFNILTLVTNINVNKAQDVYAYLVDNGFLYQQYIPCAEFEQNGKPKEYTVTGEQWGDFLCAIFDEWYKKDVYRVSIRMFDAVINGILGQPTGICHMGTQCNQYFVVEHNGDIYPCDFFVQKKLKLGNIFDNTWEEMQNSPLYKKFAARKNNWNQKCEQCKWNWLCAGDCPKMRFYKNEDSHNLSWLCAGWQKFFSHTYDKFKELADEVKRNQLRNMLYTQDT